MYRNGQIELAEQPINVHDDTPVIVTFLHQGQIDLRQRGIDAAQAANVRAQLAAFVDEWDSPEMTIYDDYDAAKPSV